MCMHIYYQTVDVTALNLIHAKVKTENLFDRFVFCLHSILIVIELPCNLVENYQIHEKIPIKII